MQFLTQAINFNHYHLILRCFVFKSFSEDLKNTQQCNQGTQHFFHSTHLEIFSKLLNKIIIEFCTI